MNEIRKAVKPRFYVVLHDGKAFFKDGVALLKFLDENKPAEGEHFEVGCQHLTDEGFGRCRTINDLDE